MRALRIFYCERNLVVVNKLIKNGTLDSIFRFFANEIIAEQSLEMLTLMVKYGSIDLGFQGFMGERKVLRTLAGINKNISFLMAFIDLSFYFEFPSFSKFDLLEIQTNMKRQLSTLSEEKGQEFISKLYQFSFCDFPLLDNTERKKNALLSIQRENQDKYIRQNFLSQNFESDSPHFANSSQTKILFRNKCMQ